MSIIQFIVLLTWHFDMQNVNGAVVHWCMMFPRDFVNIFACGSSSLKVDDDSWDVIKGVFDGSR